MVAKYEQRSLLHLCLYIIHMPTLKQGPSVKHGKCVEDMMVYRQGELETGLQKVDPLKPCMSPGRLVLYIYNTQLQVHQPQAK